MRNGQKVQHGIGRTAGCHDHGDGVFNRFFGHDVAWLDVFLDRFNQYPGRLLGRVHFFVVRVGHGAGVGQRNAERLKCARHGVGRVHAAAAAGAGNGAALDLQQVFIAHAARGVFAHGFKHAHDVEVFALVAARQNGAAIDIDGRHIGAQHAHQATRHVLVAAAYHQHAVHPLALHAGFNAVGNDFAAHQRILHALGAHGHAVGNGGRAEHLCIAAGFFNGGNGGIGQLLQAAVARRDGAVPVGHANHGLFEVAFLVAHGVVHGAVGCAGLAFGDVFAARVERDGLGFHGGCLFKWGFTEKPSMRVLIDSFQSIICVVLICMAYERCCRPTPSAALD